MKKYFHIKRIKSTAKLINTDVLKDSLEDLLKGMEEYRHHKNMTWLKKKVKNIIKEIE